jgi:hypothetical protein
VVSIDEELEAAEPDTYQSRPRSNQKGEGDFRTTLESLISLASRAAELFERSKPEQKRQLLAFVFSNVGPAHQTAIAELMPRRGLVAGGLFDRRRHAIALWCPHDASVQPMALLARRLGAAW